jgi:hypothetical protein
MNATASYSPFRAAFAELTSDRAQQYYVHKAQHDIQTTLDAAVSIYCMAAAVGQFLLDFYASYLTALPEVVERLGVIEEEVLLLSAPQPRLLLPAQTVPHRGRDRQAAIDPAPVVPKKRGRKPGSTARKKKAA